MRLINLNELKPGMELGRTIYNGNGQVLVKEGVILKDILITNIKKLNTSWVYINDEFSREIEIKDAIDPQLKNEAVQKVKNLFSIVQNGRTDISKEMKPIHSLLTDIMDQVVSNRHSMVNLVDLKNHEEYTFQHSVNVTILSTVLGVALKYPPKALLSLSKGALFHGIGKMLIAKEILNKPGKFTEEEFKEMKNYPLYGYEFAKKHLDLPNDALIAILHHHEKNDGTGYPHSKSGDEIHRNAQIVGICDVYDALTSKRIYNEAILPSHAIEYIIGNSSRHFDQDIVELFLKKVAAYPLGISVELNNGTKGLVCENFENNILRPKIKVFTENEKENVYINLSDKEHSSTMITKVNLQP